MTFSDLFTITIIQRQITWKWYNIQLYLQWLTNRKSNVIYQPAPLSMTLNDAYRSFKVMPFFDTEYLRNGMTYRHCFNEILVATYTHPTQQCNFEWPWVTWQNIQWRFVSDAKRYQWREASSVTRSVTRSLFDNWASCPFLHFPVWKSLSKFPFPYFPHCIFRSHIFSIPLWCKIYFCGVRFTSVLQKSHQSAQFYIFGFQSYGDKNDLGVFYYQFLPHDGVQSTSYAMAQCLTVCPSLAVVYCVETSKHILTFHSRTILVFEYEIWQNSKDVFLNGGHSFIHQNYIK